MSNKIQKKSHDLASPIISIERFLDHSNIDVPINPYHNLKTNI